MRLWLKLAVLLGLAVGAQWWLDRNAAAIERARLGLLYEGRAMSGDRRPSDDAIIVATDRVRQEDGDVAELVAAR